MKHVIVLPDGTELSSGPGTKCAIASVALKTAVNTGRELNPGSVCAAALTVTLLGRCPVTAGDSVTLLRQREDGTRQQVGVFLLENPTVTCGTVTVQGYDRVTLLDRDLTAWLESLTGWPYNLLSFAKLVCSACGLSLVTQDIPNAAFPVKKFTRDAVTGRQLLQWIGEACCRFVRANATGGIELGWYAPAAAPLTAGGGDFYYRGSLRYELYRVAPVTAVQLRLVEKGKARLWPAVSASDNVYIVAGNPLFCATGTAEAAALETIRGILSAAEYTPCTVELPLGRDIEPGSILTVTDGEGTSFTTWVMRAVQNRHRVRLECTGSPNRGSAGATNSATAKSRLARQELLAQSAAAVAVESQTQTELSARLTMPASVAALDSTCASGWYYFSETATVAGITANHWYLHVAAYSDGQKQCTQYLYPVRSNLANRLVRRRVAGDWYEWEHEDPPMTLNTEYRTTERWQNQSVYTRLVSVTVGGEDLNILDAGIGRIVRYEAVMEDGGITRTLPTWRFVYSSGSDNPTVGVGTAVQVQAVAGGSLQVRVGTNESGAVGMQVYVRLWYTKQ